VRAGELKESQPVIGFLAPADTNAAALGEPTKSPLNHPAPCWILGLTRYGTHLHDRLSTPPTVLDMYSIVFQFHKLMHIVIIIAFVHADMLLHLIRVGSRHDDRDNQIVSQPLIMDIGITSTLGRK
jgi:hypothetical protein